MFAAENQALGSRRAPCVGDGTVNRRTQIINDLAPTFALQRRRGRHGRHFNLASDGPVSRRCVLFHVAAMVVHARNKALLAEVRGSRALLTGLAGETWTRLVGGEFA